MVVSAQAQSKLVPALKLASVDLRCPECNPEAEDAAELCAEHFEQRWPLAVAA